MRELGHWSHAAALVPLVGLFSACVLAQGQGVDTLPGNAERNAQLLVPPGHGTLRQDDITLTLLVGDLQLKVTPLEEWVLRLIAPDTWSRLSSLAAIHQEQVVLRTGMQDPALFLVSFFSRVPGTVFRPEEVQLVNRGRRQRPLLIRPVTAAWGSERLEQEVTQLAVYAFSEGVELEQALTVEYGLEVASGWAEILRRLEVERSRARARAGLGPT